MPVKEPLKNISNYPKLVALFKITDPINNEIEQLKKDYDIDGGIFDAKDKLAENYRKLDFHNLEKRLMNEILYNLL